MIERGCSPLTRAAWLMQLSQKMMRRTAQPDSRLDLGTSLAFALQTEFNVGSSETTPATPPLPATLKLDISPQPAWQAAPTHFNLCVHVPEPEATSTPPATA